MGRVAIGAGALLATRPTLRALGFPQAGPNEHALARLVGARDAALGGLALAARDDRAALRAAVLAAACVDAADAISLGFAAREERLRVAGLGGALFGSAAAVAGFRAWRQLRP